MSNYEYLQILHGSATRCKMKNDKNDALTSGCQGQVPYQCTPPHMRTSCPHDIVSSGLLESMLVDVRLQESSHGRWCSALASVKGNQGQGFPMLTHG